MITALMRRCDVFGPSYSQRAQTQQAGETSSHLQPQPPTVTVFERPDRVYQNRSRTVARIDLVSSCLTLLLAMCMFGLVVKIGNFKGLFNVSDRQDAFWGVKVIMELISIPFAVKLLRSTRQSERQQDPKGAAYWCNVWLMSCTFWIFFYLASIAVIIKLGVRHEHEFDTINENLHARTFFYMKIAIMATIIVLRLGAINIVILYIKQLRMHSYRQQNALKASLIVGIQPIVRFE